MNPDPQRRHASQGLAWRPPRQVSAVRHNRCDRREGLHVATRPRLPGYQVAVSALEELFAFEFDASSEFPPVGSVAELQAYVADLVAATMAAIPTDDNVKAVLDGLGQPRYPRPARWRWMVNATRGWWEGRCCTCVTVT